VASERHPEEVRLHDFAIPELGRAAPCGVYDLAGNTGWVGVGVDHDTASFAVETTRRWWCAMGQEKYPRASRLSITVDGGGSNGSRVRLWKLELQRLADETGMAIAVSHFPPGTSKWNKIEHRLTMLFLNSSLLRAGLCPPARRLRSRGHAHRGAPPQ